MGVEEFTELFLRELERDKSLTAYYRLINNKRRFLWRKAYFEQRLKYVAAQVGTAPADIWDAGCGYGTTAIFLALNGFSVKGNTLEFYYNRIADRMDYWSRYGNLDKLSIDYANLFDMRVPENSFDIIVAQDTLHHLEPIHDALKIFAGSLKKGGRLIVTEENGMSFFIKMKNFSRRGFKRISEYHDENLNKTILFGNENARSLREWKRLFISHGFDVPEQYTEFIRLFPHFFYNESNYPLMKERETHALRKLPLIHEFLFFGINFTAIQNFNNIPS